MIPRPIAQQGVPACRPAGIVAGVLAIALAVILAFQAGKRSGGPDRVAPGVIPGSPLPSPAEAKQPASPVTPTPAPEAPEERRIQHAVIEVTIAPPRRLVPTALPCLDQAAALLPVLRPLIFDFKQEAEIALSTPRLSVASEISKLQEIYNKTMRLDDWPAPSCGYVLRSAVGHAEGFDIARLKAFLSGSNFSLAEAAKKHWDYADVQLRLMQDRVRSGRN